MTSENQLRVDVGKDFCARGCMNTIGKDKLRSLRRYYFSLTGDEQDTYLGTKMQMVKAICVEYQCIMVVFTPSSLSAQVRAIYVNRIKGSCPK